MLAQVEGVGQAGRGALNSAYALLRRDIAASASPLDGKKSAMPQDTNNLIEVLLLICGVVIAGFAIGGAVQAWRSWSDHRRIERDLGRR